MSIQLAPMPSNVTLSKVQNGTKTREPIDKIDIIPVNALDGGTRIAIDRLALENETKHLKNAFFNRDSVEASADFSRKAVFWLLLYSANSLTFAAPVVQLGIPGVRCLKIQTHNYAPLGTPLMSDGFDPAVFQQRLYRMGYQALICPVLERKSKFAQKFNDPLSVFWSSHISRAWLRPGWSEEQILSSKRRKELRRLAKKVPLDHNVLRGAAARDEGFKEFCRLEALGWKGDFGTAIKQEEHVFSYANALVGRHAEEGTLTLDCLRDGDRTVAMLITFQSGGRGAIWKVAHDPEYDHVSPGRQVILAATKRFLEENPNVSMDSLADENHPLINKIWPDRLDLGTMALALGRSNLPAKILSGLDELETRLRAKARIVRKRLRG
ncbi:MAG: GNAT family N-acetyltransferase [Hyphomicrobiales bacterium]